MEITKELLEMIHRRGENLKKETELDKILNTCLRSAINGFDSDEFKYDENNEEEVKKMNNIAEELRKKNLKVHFDGDEGNMYMFVSWN